MKASNAGALVVLLAACAAGGWWWAQHSGSAPQPTTAAPRVTAAETHDAPTRKAFKVLHVMSYEADWKVWTIAQLDAFQEQLADLDVEYKVVELDGRRNDAPEAIRAKVDEARRIIETWRPDLVYTTDDLAAEKLIKPYVGSDLPFVFSGVNREAGYYGFTGSPNVTGVLEREHILQTVQLFAKINPKAKRLAIVTDMGQTWPGVIQRFRDLEDQLPLEIVAVDILESYAQYQEKLTQYEHSADAVCTLGQFLFKDESGNNVPMEEVGKWTHENVKLANISFWDSRPPVGVLCVVAVSGKAQGEAAGRLARGILAEGKRPSDFPIEATTVGRPIINLAVARKLGLTPPSTLLLSSEVTERLDWSIP